MTLVTVMPVTPMAAIVSRRVPKRSASQRMRTSVYLFSPTGVSRRPEESSKGNGTSASVDTGPSECTPRVDSIGKKSAYALAREEGIPHINMDVIAGLPGESLHDFRRTMEEAEQLRPESLTVHTLAIKRSSPWGEQQTAERLRRTAHSHREGTAVDEKNREAFSRQEPAEKPMLPSGETAAEMVRLGGETAGKMGMRPYYLYKQKYMAGNLENTGYALPGHECIYNVDIMEETSHILALGAGGISKRIYPEEGHIGRAPNVSHIETYIDRLEEMIQRKRILFLES